MGSARTFSMTGFLFAIGSAATFALSGSFASALMAAGWSPGAATTMRLTCAALVLLIPTIVMMRGKWDLALRAWKSLLLFGLLAVAGCQLAFFSAVQFISPSLALLIEFMGPVILIFWVWARSRIAPSKLTLLGVVIAVCGLVAISGVLAGVTIHPLGIIFGLVAAIGNATYFATSADANHGIPPLPFAGLGVGIGAIALIIVSATGALPFVITASPAVIGGAELQPAVIVAGLAVIATVTPYILGVIAARSLGATVASFAGYSEALFGIFWPIVLLALVPTPLEWCGAALIVIGVITVRAGEMAGAKRAPVELDSVR